MNEYSALFGVYGFTLNFQELSQRHCLDHNRGNRRRPIGTYRIFLLAKKDSGVLIAVRTLHVADV